MSHISHRLKEIRQQKKLSQVKFAQALDVTSASISNYEAGKRQPDYTFLSRICERFHVNLNWLLTGEGEMYQQLYEIDSSILDDLITLPIVAEIAAGEPVEALLDEPLGHMSIPKKLLYYPPPYFVFSVKGRSMEPYIMNKDIVVCSQSWAGVDLNGKIMAFRTHDGITLKKLVFDTKNKSTWIMPLNHEFTPRLYDPDDGDDMVLIGILDIAIRGYNRNQ